MFMSDLVKLIECPRDAWQGLKGQIPPDIKRAYLQALISAGFKHIDAVSFVSPKAVPQMADSEEVIKELDPPDDVEIIGIVVNEKERSAPSKPRRSTRWAFLIRFPKPSCARIKINLRKKHSKNSRKFRKRPTMRPSMSSSTSPWPSVIPTATFGMPKK